MRIRGTFFRHPEVVAITIKALEKRGIKVSHAANGDEALATVRKLIPPNAEVMSGSSTTLIEIGFEDYVAGGKSGWNLLHTKITAEDDPVKRAELRRKSVTADYFISSVNAISREVRLLLAMPAEAVSVRGLLLRGILFWSQGSIKLSPRSRTH